MMVTIIEILANANYFCLVASYIAILLIAKTDKSVSFLLELYW